MEPNIIYPKIQLDDYEPRFLSHPVFDEVDEHNEDTDLLPLDDFERQENMQPKDCECEAPQCSGLGNDVQNDSSASHQEQGRYFYYDAPHYEDTGVWIPVSVPPLSKSDHAEWNKGLFMNGGFFPDGDLGWDQYIQENKELTMWDVVSEMLLSARGKMTAIAAGDVHGCAVSWLSDHLLEHAWNEMEHTLTEASSVNIKEMLEAEPPKWLADSATSACMLCNVRFHPIMCSRHHCRFCGGIFCNECSKERSLLPAKFRTSNPERVCDVCCVRLEPVQSYLMDQASRAAQYPTHDLTDLSALRSWLNFPWGQTLEYEVYKAANTILGYNKELKGREFTERIEIL